MTDIKIFKEIASTNLPGALYQELEPHLNSLHEAISWAEYMEQEYEYHIAEVNSQRFRKLRDEFEVTIRPLWSAFARERWPEIDKYFAICPVVSSESDSLPF